MQKANALEHGKAVELTDSELAELKRWTPPYVTLTVKILGLDRNLVTAILEDD